MTACNTVELLFQIYKQPEGFFHLIVVHLNQKQFLNTNTMVCTCRVHLILSFTLIFCMLTIIVILISFPRYPVQGEG